MQLHPGSPGLCSRLLLCPSGAGSQGSTEQGNVIVPAARGGSTLPQDGTAPGTALPQQGQHKEHGKKRPARPWGSQYKYKFILFPEQRWREAARAAAPQYMVTRASASPLPSRPPPSPSLPGLPGHTDQPLPLPTARLCTNLA